jgi:hypothetical protein
MQTGLLRPDEAATQTQAREILRLAIVVIAKKKKDATVHATFDACIPVVYLLGVLRTDA